MNNENTGLPGDLHDAIVQRLRVHIPNYDYSKCKVIAEDIVLTFIKHYEAEAERENNN